MTIELHPAHWTHEEFGQRMTTAQWREMLLEQKDTIMVEGHLRQLIAKKLFAGVVEVKKEGVAKCQDEAYECDDPADV